MSLEDQVKAPPLGCDTARSSPIVSLTQFFANMSSEVKGFLRAIIVIVYIGIKETFVQPD